MVPVRVRAHLACGIAQAAPWGIALDGLLASQLWEGIKAQRRAAGAGYVRAMDCADPPDLELPLARCQPYGAGSPVWHWAATCALPEPVDGRQEVQVRHWTAQVDARDLERVAERLPKSLPARQGRFRARRMPLLVSVCASVSWQAVGDPQAIRALLDPVRTIGKKRSSGEGHVLAWEVEQVEVDGFTAGHLHADGSLGRPCPAPCRQQAGQVADGGLGRAGLRPPYMHPGRQQELWLPALLGS